MLKVLGFKGREKSMKRRAYGEAYWFVDYHSLRYRNQEGITVWIRIQFYDPQVDCLLMGKKMGKSAGICALSFSVNQLESVVADNAAFIPDMEAASRFGREIAGLMQQNLGKLMTSVPNEVAMVSFMLSNPLLQTLAPVTIDNLVRRLLKSYDERGLVLRPEIVADLTRRAENLVKLSGGMADGRHGMITVANIGS